MNRRDQANRLCAPLMLTAAALLLANPSSAQDYPLFDTFSVALEGSWVKLDTHLRLDSKELGRGTELDFENDGGLAKSKTIPTVRFDWRPGSRHLVFGWWQSVSRDSTYQILKEIRFGDVVFPVDEVVQFGFDTDEIAVGYAYLPVVNERLALGVGLGLRTLRVGASLAADNLELRSDGDFTGPLPFVDLDFRYGITPRLRFISRLGAFYIEFGDYAGSQFIFDLSIEHLTFGNLAFGGGINGALVDAEVDTSDYKGTARIYIAGARVYVKLRL